MNNVESSKIYGRLAIAVFLILLFAVSTLYAIRKTLIWMHAEEIPAPGGALKEGAIGQPVRFHPLGPSPTQGSQDLIALIYASLFKYDELGLLKPDIVQEYDILADGRVYDLYLRDNVYWHDDKNLTAEDVAYTIGEIRSGDSISPYKSPMKDVEVELPDTYTIRFILPKPSSYFLNNLTFPIVRSDYNDNSIVSLQKPPLGAGPFKVERIKRDKGGSIEYIYLQAHDKYHYNPPLIKKIFLYFFTDESRLLENILSGKITSGGISSPTLLSGVDLNEEKYSLRYASLNRVFGLFINHNQNPLLRDNTIRKALSFLTDREGIVQRVFSGRATAAKGPFLSHFLGFNSNSSVPSFDPKRAKDLLESEGWNLDKNGVYEKGSDVLKFTVHVPDIEELKEVANYIRQDWERFGVGVDIVAMQPQQLFEQIIRPRKYELLLIAQALKTEPDPYPLWHSSAIRDPGLNVAMYANKRVDNILEAVRGTINQLERIRLLQEFQDYLAQDLAAIFLYSPEYSYIYPKNLSGLDFQALNLPKDRFAKIYTWSLKVKRKK